MALITEWAIAGMLAMAGTAVITTGSQHKLALMSPGN